MKRCHTEIEGTKREDVKIEIAGLGQFHTLNWNVTRVDEIMTTLDLQREINTWLTPEGADIANKLPRWMRVIIVAGILHPLN